MKVLIIDDDKNIIESLKMTFNICWPETVIISTRLGEEGIQMVEEQSPDIAILDLGLPDISGFEVLKKIRQFSNIPIIILTVRGDEPDLVMGLGLGADDYIVKPFKQMEFLARIQANLRRQNIITEETSFVKGPFILNAYNHELLYNKKSIVLTRTECVIFLELIKNANKIVTYSRLAEVLWGREYSGSDEAIRVYVKRLRQKLENHTDKSVYISTSIGKGYIFNLPIL